MKSLPKTVNCFEHEGVPVMQMNMRSTRCLAFMILLVFLLGGPTSLWALTLGEAKAKGLVGETPEGYLGIVSGKGSREVRALVKDVNQKRKQKYRGVAKHNGTSLQTVEVLAGKNLIKRTRPGHFIQLPSKKWTKK